METSNFKPCSSRGGLFTIFLFIGIIGLLILILILLLNEFADLYIEIIYILFMIGMAIILGRFIIAFYTISHEIICLTTITGEIYGISPEKKEDFLNVLKKYKNSIEIIQ